MHLSSVWKFLEQSLRLHKLRIFKELVFLIICYLGLHQKIHTGNLGCLPLQANRTHSIMQLKCLRFFFLADVNSHCQLRHLTQMINNTSTAITKNRFTAFIVTYHHTFKKLTKPHEYSGCCDIQTHRLYCLNTDKD